MDPSRSPSRSRARACSPCSATRDHRPHLAGRRDQEGQPAGPWLIDTGSRSATSTPTARAAATTR
jgi:hypothetical protein